MRKPDRTVLALLSIIAALETGCGMSTTYETPIVSEARVWVADPRTQDVYRCADLSLEGRQPEPVCVKAVLLDHVKQTEPTKP